MKAEYIERLEVLTQVLGEGAARFPAVVQVRTLLASAAGVYEFFHELVEDWFTEELILGMTVAARDEMFVPFNALNSLVEHISGMYGWRDRCGPFSDTLRADPLRFQLAESLGVADALVNDIIGWRDAPLSIGIAGQLAHQMLEAVVALKPLLLVLEQTTSLAAIGEEFDVVLTRFEQLMAVPSLA